MKTPRVVLLLEDFEEKQLRLADAAAVGDFQAGEELVDVGGGDADGYEDGGASF